MSFQIGEIVVASKDIDAGNDVINKGSLGVVQNFSRLADDDRGYLIRWHSGSILRVEGREIAPAAVPDNSDRFAEQEEILAEVARLWRKWPDWRFGQFVLNKSRDGNGSVNESLAWNRHDADWLRLLEGEAN